MNVIRARQEERTIKIKQIEGSIKKAKKPDYNKLLMMCCSEWGMSKRVVKEYIEIAMFNLGIKA